jgi:carboxyl-terminal processing protease
MQKRPFLTFILASIFILNVFAVEKKQTDPNFEISKNLDIYNAVLKELNIYYVDTIKPGVLVKESIDKMLESLDPYTTFIPEEDTKDLKFMTTGEYGGIGSMISQNKENEIVISEPYEGMPAEKAGLRAGDVILEVDGVSLKGKNVSNVSELLKGQPGTDVKITIKHFIDKKPVTKTITREKILINPVSYYGIVAPKTGYILLSQFTDKAGDEVKSALLDLKNNFQIESLILDLRNNPGGLINQAVDITNLFVPKGIEIVATKGKVKQFDDNYKSTEEPLDPKIPLTVLVNSNTASASEIVSGALQDLDRAVIIGTRTFGKGLVQATREVSYNGHLKLTTAKYYIPSGRCIQALDYSHKNEDGSIASIPDSLTKEFKTKGGRIVRDGGGISPDLEVKNEQKLNISYYLYNKNMIFDFATEYVAKNKKIASPEEFKLSDQDYQEFKDFLKKQNFSYTLRSAEYLKKLKEIADFEGYGEMSKDEFTALEKKLAGNTDRDLDLFKKDIEDLLNAEIIKRYYYQKGEIRYQLKDDPELKKALEVLSDKSAYENLLRPKK